MKHKILELEKRIIILEKKVKEFEGNKIENSKEKQNEKLKENYQPSNEEENDLNDFLAY